MTGPDTSTSRESAQPTPSLRDQFLVLQGIENPTIEQIHEAADTLTRMAMFVHSRPDMATQGGSIGDLGRLLKLARWFGWDKQEAQRLIAERDSSN